MTETPTGFHTPSEARDMRCCGPEGCGEARAVKVHVVGAIEGTTSMIQRFCIGPDCQAWRWPIDKVRDDATADVISGLRRDGWTLTSDGREFVFVQRRSDIGFCGLAGPA